MLYLGKYCFKHSYHFSTGILSQVTVIALCIPWINHTVEWKLFSKADSVPQIERPGALTE